MAEYIDKNATVGILETVSRSTDCECIKKRLEKAAKLVGAIPAADVAPVVHGRWTPSESDFDDDDTLFDVEEWCDWQCSACREDICYEDPMPPRLLPKHCPNCGAKMDGGNS